MRLTLLPERSWLLRWVTSRNGLRDGQKRLGATSGTCLADWRENDASVGLWNLPGIPTDRNKCDLRRLRAGSQATRVVNSPFEPFPTYELGQNVLPPVTIAP